MLVLPTIRTNKRKFFRQYLELLRTIPPFVQLRTRELDLLGEIMYQRYKYRSFDEDGALNAFVFSAGMRKKMRDNLSMSEATFNNNLSYIKKHGIIKDKYELIPILNIVPDKEFNISFKFDIQE